MKTLVTLRLDVLTRLGDVLQRVWTAAEVDQHLKTAYAQLATLLGVFWDVTYLENVPRGFSYTAAWEQAMLADLRGYDFGRANYTCTDDALLLGDERQWIGPGHYTSGFELNDGWCAQLRITADLPATADVPKTLTALDRVTWDKRGIDAMEARRIAQVDRRYELTKGEVYGYIWQKDGVRTLRKVRVPAALASLASVVGSWGVLRRPTDLSASTVTGTWGVPRRIPGQFPMGPTQWGLPRRPYLEGTNVRLEHFRQGAAMTTASDACELPDRYALYLRDYAQWQLLSRKGPGQDLKLAAHFQQRWTRNLARLERRIDAVNREHVPTLGGDDVALTTRPPRPQLPWPYGSRVR